MEKQKVIKKLRKMRDTVSSDFPRFKGRAAFEASFDDVLSQIGRYKLSDNIMGLLLREKEKQFKETKAFIEAMLPPKNAG